MPELTQQEQYRAKYALERQQRHLKERQHLLDVALHTVDTIQNATTPQAWADDVGKLDHTFHVYEDLSFKAAVIWVGESPYTTVNTLYETVTCESNEHPNMTRGYVDTIGLHEYYEHLYKKELSKRRR